MDLIGNIPIFNDVKLQSIQLKHDSIQERIIQKELKPNVFYIDELESPEIVIYFEIFINELNFNGQQHLFSLISESSTLTINLGIMNTLELVLNKQVFLIQNLKTMNDWVKVKL